MSEVKYSLNGKLFKDYGVYVSESFGLMDALKRRPVKSYQWAEYHGESVDLSNPKYEAREIALNCFIVGENWQDLFNQFNFMIRDEFAKPGTQRLHIKPFGYNTLAYEVYITDEIKVDKRFRNGEMVGIFTMKLIEPNPIKKVLKASQGSISLSYESTSETEIFWGDGTKSVVAGNASVSSRSVPTNAIVIIAGNINEITNFTTNVAVLWEKL